VDRDEDVNAGTRHPSDDSSELPLSRTLHLVDKNTVTLHRISPAVSEQFPNGTSAHKKPLHAITMYAETNNITYNYGIKSRPYSYNKTQKMKATNVES